MAQPDLIPAPFAENATPGTIEPIPPLTPSVPQQATWSSGFPQVTMQPLASGGIPPRGQDFNGVLNALSQHIFHMQGGGQYKWSDDHGPYSIGDVLQSDDGLSSYVSVVDNNTDNFNITPSAIGDTWIAWGGNAMGGRLINVRYFSSSGSYTYSSTPGTKNVVVEVQGGGGAGGGARATNASQASMGGGGGAGAYARKRILSGFDGVTVTVGAGGNAISGENGGAGGTSSFGAHVSAPGGLGGQRAGPDGSLNLRAAGGAVSSPSSGGDINSQGQPGLESFVSQALNNIFGGFGAPSFFGSGSQRSGSGAGFNALSPGSGGSGATHGPNQGANNPGGHGADGVVVIWEYA